MAQELTAEDRNEIRELIARYSHLEDSGAAEEWAELFTVDGSFTGGKGNIVQGREALRDFAAKRWLRPEVREYVHWISNIVITATEEGAESVSYQMLVQKDSSTGEYFVRKLSGKLDRIKREDGRWKFYNRAVTPLPVEEPAAVPA